MFHRKISKGSTSNEPLCISFSFVRTHMIYVLFSPQNVWAFSEFVMCFFFVCVQILLANPMNGKLLKPHTSRVASLRNWMIKIRHAVVVSAVYELGAAVQSRIRTFFFCQRNELNMIFDLDYATDMNLWNRLDEYALKHFKHTEFL